MCEHIQAIHAPERGAQITAILATRQLWKQQGGRFDYSLQECWYFGYLDLAL
jgi:hypothetical protein